LSEEQSERTIGEIAYNGYREKHAELAGPHRIYEWAELHEKQRECWESAAKAIIEAT
jgi:hypothetical protein